MSFKNAALNVIIENNHLSASRMVIKKPSPKMLEISKKYEKKFGVRLYMGLMKYPTIKS